MEVRRLRSASDEFQVLRSLLTSRVKRHRRQQLLVQGARPVTVALEAGWPLAGIVTAEPDQGGRRSRWADDVIASAPAPVHWVVAPDLMAELAGKDEPAEVLAVAELPDRPIDDLRVGEGDVVCVCDRVALPGNLGSIIRSADAFGVRAVVVTERSADPWDPQTVRASTGSVFAVPVHTAPGWSGVLAWAERERASGVPLRLVATDERGEPLTAAALVRPVAVVAGNETAGLSEAARAACDATVAIPVRGSASSLNVAVATSIVLHEATRG